MLLYVALPDAVVASIAELAPEFAGVATVDDSDGREFELVTGVANRAYGVPITVDSRFGIASGSKVFTAIIVLRLARRGLLTLDAPVRTWLGADLPLIAQEVTLEHLLTHTSGIGDYFDEDLFGDNDYILSEPVHRLTTSEAFLPLLEGFPMREVPGETFRYNNGGLVVAAIVAERASGRTYAELVEEEVTGPAGLTMTGILRTDSLPGDVALGYIDDDGLQTNLLHLPVLATGDGGAFTNARDVLRFWQALTGGLLVTADDYATMTRPRNFSPQEGMRYGLGMWLHATGPALIMEGCDPGQSFRSTHDPETGLTATVFGNTADNAWGIVKALATLFDAE